MDGLLSSKYEGDPIKNEGARVLGAIVAMETLQKIFPRTGGRIYKKLGMLDRGLQSIIVCSNDDHGVTLTYFTARSNFLIWAFP